MKTGKAILFAAIVAILMAGCGMSRHDRHVAAMLDRAEAVMQSHPDSARAIVDSIDATAIGSDALRARYALDLHEAMFKNYIETPDDSLISFAADYYADRGDNASLAKARYFQGRALRNAANYPAATFAALHADDAASGAGLTIWRARANELLADLCLDTYNIYEDTVYIRRAANLYLAADSLRNYQYDMIDLGRSLSNCNEEERALQVLDSIAMEISPSDSSFIYYLNESRANVFVKLGRYKEALTEYEKNSAFKNRWEKDVYGISNRGLVLLKIEGTAKADSVIKDLEKRFCDTESRHNPYYLELKYEFFKQKKMSDSALYFHQLWMKAVNTELLGMIDQSTLKAQRDYVSVLNKEIKKRHKAQKIYSIICIILLVGLIVMMFLYINDKKKNFKKEIKAKIDEINTTNHRLNESIKNFKQLNSRNESLTDDYIRDIEDVLDKFSRISSKLDKNELIIKNLEALKKKILTPDFLKLLEIFADRYTEGSYSKIKALDFVLEKDKQLILFYLAKFSTNSTCQILGLTETNYHTRMGRVRSDLRNSDKEDIRNLASRLSKKGE